MTDSAELLVMKYLVGLRQIKPARDIQVGCPDYWVPDGIYHSPMTYNRAWQRLVQHGRVKIVREWRERGAKVVQIKPVTAKDIKGFQPIPHGGK